ncbi:MAG: ribokinase [Eubacteriales bacterium]|nr:ribokinase [Eubacteriales bacterium]
MKVLNFGSLNVDYVYQVDHMVTAGETLTSDGRSIFCGGKGLNQSIALSRAGVPVYHAGIIGTDGDILLEKCRENHVDTEFISKLEEPGGHTIIQVDRTGQNCILLYAGTNRRITKEYVDGVLENFEAGDILVLQNEISSLDYIIDRAYEKKMMIILNPSPFDALLDACDLKKVSLFMVNEIEGYQMTGEQDPDKILEKMKELYPEAGVVLTLGSHGSVYQDQMGRYYQDICKVKVVDTTAAGDTFTGYFVAAMLKHMPVQDGLALAAKASAITVSRSGAADSIPSVQEVESWAFGE